MKEVLEKEILSLSDHKYALFLYTPFCGTCKLAERMLDIVEQTLPNIMLYKGNVNYMPSLCQEWKIESVPCGNCQASCR